MLSFTIGLVYGAINLAYSLYEMLWYSIKVWADMVI